VAQIFDDQKTNYYKALRTSSSYNEPIEQSDERTPIHHGTQMNLSNTHMSSFGSQYSHPDAQQHFRKLRKLGQGSYGEVHEVVETSTGDIYAQKRIHLLWYGRTKAEREKQVRNEVNIMRKLSHQHIPQVSTWSMDLDGNACSIYMQPAADYDLRYYLLKCTHDGYPKEALEKMFTWFGCLLDALQFAHRQDILHRDIKPSNILIKNNKVYLADFGSAKDFGPEGPSATSNTAVCGTPVYRAPEFRNKEYRSSKADVFSLGCVFSEMLTVHSGKSMEDFQEWRRTNDETDSYAFRTNLGRVREWLDKLIVGDVTNLKKYLVNHVQEMLHKDPTERPLAEESVRNLAMRQRGAFFCDLH